jgi:hypothetical protein
MDGFLVFMRADSNGQQRDQSPRCSRAPMGASTRASSAAQGKQFAANCAEIPPPQLMKFKGTLVVLFCFYLGWIPCLPAGRERAATRQFHAKIFY